MDARTPGPAIEVISIRWERVQLILEARILPGATVDPAGLELAKVGGPEAMAPTHVATAGDRLTLRYNAILGPGQQPLEPGRWRLRAGVSSALAGSDDPPIGDFPLRQGLYRVRPGLDGDANTLALDVSFDPAVRREPATTIAGRLRKARRDLMIGVRRVAFRLLVSISKWLLRPRRRRVLFTSRLISEMSGNLKIVHDRMVERGLDRELDLVTMLRPGLTEHWGLADRVRLAGQLASASVIVIDDTFLPLYWLSLRPDVRIIQLWHASGAFKTVGYSRTGKHGDLSPFGRVHKNYSAAIVSSAFDAPFYAEAFGIPEERVIPTGIPRMDRFFDERWRQAGIQAAPAAFPAIAGRTVILLAPTYRGETIKDAFYGFDQIDYAGLHALCLERDAVVIIKMHPFVQARLAVPEAFRDRILDGSASSMDVNDLLFAVDLLITDYSSIVFEFSTLGRPMLFFAYDLEEYIAERDFYVPYETFVPGRIVRTFPELLDAIRHDAYEVEKVAPFAARHFAHFDARSTDRVIDDLILAR